MPYGIDVFVPDISMLVSKKQLTPTGVTQASLCSRLHLPVP